MIPSQTQADLKNGIWMIHQDGENVIQIWCSNWNGKEKVYLNGELKSDQRNLKSQNDVDFVDDSGQKYLVKIEAQVRKRLIFCTILKDQKEIKSYKIKYYLGKKLVTQKLIAILVFGGTFGVIQAMYKLPKYSHWVFIAIFVAVLMLIRPKTQFDITED